MLSTTNSTPAREGGHLFWGVYLMIGSAITHGNTVSGIAADVYVSILRKLPNDKYLVSAYAGEILREFVVFKRELHVINLNTDQQWVIFDEIPF